MRDACNRRMLRKLGWRVVVVWECETERSRLARQLQGRLDKLLTHLHANETQREGL